MEDMRRNVFLKFIQICMETPCWRPPRWAPTWRLHTNLYKFGENVSPHIFRKKNCCDLNLGEGLCISTFFLFPDSRLNLLNAFDFLFWSILNGVTLKTSNYSMVVYHTGGSRGLLTVCANGKQKSLVVSSIRIGHFTIYLPIPNFLRETRMSSTRS